MGLRVAARRHMLYSPLHRPAYPIFGWLLVAGSSHTRPGILGYMF